jgi:hypothetical protein
VLATESAEKRVSKYSKKPADDHAGLPRCRIGQCGLDGSMTVKGLAGALARGLDRLLIVVCYGGNLSGENSDSLWAVGGRRLAQLFFFASSPL